MWRILNLKCPTEDFCPYNTQEETILQELPKLVSLLTVSAELLTKDNPIWSEINFFQNVQEKYKRILQCDKCLQVLQTIGNSVRKMVLLNLSKIYLDLAEQFLMGLGSKSSPILLPSRQQLEFALLRTQTAAKLMCETLRYSRETFCYLIQKLKMGHLILNLMMATSVAARLNLVFKDILVQLFDIYKKLYIWRKKLKKGTTEWPNPLELPKDLENWLCPESSNFLKSEQIPEGQIAFLSEVFKQKKNGAKSSNINDTECILIGESSQSEAENIDVEEVVQSPKSSKKAVKRSLTDSQSLLLEKIQNAESLKKLKNIWNHLDVGSHALLREDLKPNKIRDIERTFLTAKRKLKKVKQSDESFDAKEVQNINVIQSTKKKIAKLLGLIEDESGSSSLTGSSVLPVKKLKSVKKLKDLKLLYNTLYKMLQSTQQYDKCAELEKKFKDRKCDIKHLIEINRRKIAKQLIMCTSKEFLSRFKE